MCRQLAKRWLPEGALVAAVCLYRWWRTRGSSESFEGESSGLGAKVSHRDGIVVIDWWDFESETGYNCELWPDGARSIAGELFDHAEQVDNETEMAIEYLEGMANGDAP